MGCKVAFVFNDEPISIRGFDFTSLTISEGVVTIENGERIHKFKYEDIKENMAIWVERDSQVK